MKSGWVTKKLGEVCEGNFENNMNNYENNFDFFRAQPRAGLETPRGCAATNKKLSLQLFWLFSNSIGGAE